METQRAQMRLSSHVCLQPRLAVGRRPARLLRMVPRAQAAGSPNLLSKLGRVFVEKAQGDLDRIFKGTSKTREKLGVVEELLTYWNLDEAEDTLEELEEALIASDFGPRTALKVVDVIRARVKAGEVKTAEDMRAALKSSLLELLTGRGGSTELQLGETSPGVILVVGVNGGGKTTSIGKLAHQFRQQGASVLLAAGDTFRAAAVEQLQTWSERSGARFVGPQSEKQKPASVLNKAVAAGIAEGVDVVICDTSGRLHTNFNLMDELANCKKAVTRAMDGAPQEVLLVLDGTTGLNMLNQAREFNDVVGLTGIILTKLDGTARGGAVVSVVDELGVPVKFVGVGEGIDDLRPFDDAAFVEALFPAHNPTEEREPAEAAA